MVKCLEGFCRVEEFIGVCKHTAVETVLNLLAKMTISAIDIPTDYGGHSTLTLSSTITVTFAVSLTGFSHMLSTPFLPSIFLCEFEFLLLIIQESFQKKDQYHEEDENAINYCRLILFGSK